jgi:hypothetical protein
MDGWLLCDSNKRRGESREEHTENAFDDLAFRHSSPEVLAGLENGHEFETT